MREIRARRAMLAGVLEVSVKCGRLPPNAGDLTGLVFSTRRRPHSQRPNEPMIPYLPSYDVLGRAQAYWPLCPDPSLVGVAISDLVFIWGVRSLDVGL